MRKEYTSWRITPLKALVLVVTIGLAWGALLIGRPPPVEPPRVGDPSPETYFATRRIEIQDEAATLELQDQAAAEVEDIFELDETKLDEVREAITALFADVLVGVEPPEDAVPPVPTTTIPEPATTVPEEGEGATTTLPLPAQVEGFLFVDTDGSGDYVPESGDGPLQGVAVAVIPADALIRTATTDALGFFRITDLPAGKVVVHVDYGAQGFPDLLAPSTGPFPEIELAAGESTRVSDVGFAPVTVVVPAQEAALQQKYPLLRPTTVAKLVALATGDVSRAALQESPYLDQVRKEAIQRAEGVMAGEIRNIAEKSAEIQTLYAAPRIVFFDDGTSDREAGDAVSDIVASSIEVNSFIDDQRTQEARDAARADVEPVVIVFEENQKIVDEGDLITATQLQAVDQLGLLESGAVLNTLPLLLTVASTVLLLAFYLMRFRPALWSVERRLALFGLLLVMAALAARVTAVVQTQVGEQAITFLVPAAAIGLMAAILFDARIAVLIAVGVGALASLATGDMAMVLFAGLTALAPIPFASAISARRDLRRAVVYSAAALVLLAVPIAWLFYGGEDPLIAVRDAAGAALVNGLIGGMVGVAALSFLETIFDVTTTLRLLDLTDRNHPALQLLEEKARGTFNHSLMVGTLADAGARAIGANNLLARSAAYYHDLGKTENPTFFIENQFAGFNPHDQLLPTESAQIIRLHVIDGVRLARDYRIPADVSEGILTHHGDGIMRFFYHKALERFPEGKVDVEDYRHIGHKPTSREMAILMMADAIEGACRAVFAEKDPSPEAITDVVDRVVGEKMADGQLSDSSLTLGELTKVKAAFIDALIGNYHQRITYPSFPRLEESSIAGALGAGLGVAKQRPGQQGIQTGSPGEDSSLADVE